MKMLKWIGIAFLAVVVLGAAFFFINVGRGSSVVNATYQVADYELDIPMDSLSLARGKRYAALYGCTDCHGDQLEGRIMADAPPFLMAPPNITQLLSDYSVSDWNRMIRHGIKKDGRRAIIMPVFHPMPDDRLAALIAYMRSLPLIDNEVPATEVRMLGKMIASTSEESLYEPLRLTTNYLSGIPEDDVLLLGENLTVSLCGHCHRPDFNGGPAYIPDSPPVPSLKASTSWSLAEFEKAIQTGERPSGANMSPAHMPWTAFQNLTDQETAAIHDYLKKQF